MIGVRYSGDYTAQIKFTTNDQLEVHDYRTSYKLQKVTNRRFRDTTGWYHIVVSNDNSVSSPDTKIYVNGVEQSNYSTRNNPSVNTDLQANNSVIQVVGANYYNSQANVTHDGYIAEFYMIDGQQLAPSAFAEDDGGTWSAIEYTGTFGTAGFHLDFADSSDLGNDVSGNGEHFAEVNIVSGNQITSNLPPFKS